MNILKSYITLNDLIGRYIVAQKSIDVSVIIPTFNRAALLRLGLHSIFSQNTSLSYEVIVVDDGNDKETPEVCQYYANTIQNRFMYLGLRRHIISNPMWRVPSFAKIGRAHV